MMSSPLQPGEHILSAAVIVATRIASQRGAPPRLKVVAKELGITREELRAVVPNRAALLNVMAECALQRLLHMVTIQATASSSDCPVRQAEAVAVAYVEWARLYPYEFRFLGEMPAGQLQANPRLLQYERPLQELGYKILQRAKDQGFLAPDEDLTILMAIIHTYVYGVITKMLLGDLARWTQGYGDEDPARTVISLFTQKMFRHQPHVKRTENLPSRAN